jgi:hypothetical protein
MGVAKFGYRSHSPQWKFLGIPLCSGEKLEAHVQNIWRNLAIFFQVKKGNIATEYSFLNFSISGEILQPKKGLLLHIINTWYKVYLNMYFEDLNLNSIQVALCKFTQYFHSNET